MKDIKHYLLLIESSTKELQQEKLTYSKKELSPVISEATLDYHYGKLARAYVDRFNKGEGDSNFNYGGAVLHNIYFAQFKKPGSGNSPSGAVKALIDKKYGSFEKFKEAFEKEAMAIQGSGWVYMDTAGALRTIHNHEYKKTMKIALLVDWWEHAWALDYEHDKAKYLSNIWRIINWSVINDRLQGS